MAKIRYGSFNRPLDFFHYELFGQPVEVKHNSLPIQDGQPFSEVAVDKLLSENVIHSLELKLMDYEPVRATCTECGAKIFLRKEDSKLICLYEGQLQHGSRCFDP